MKILVCGDRHWSDVGLIWTVLDGYYANASAAHMVTSLAPLVIIHGDAPGADRMAGGWAKNSPLHPPLGVHTEEQMGVNLLEFPADWNQYGKAAGPIRNREMLKKEPDLVLAFHDDLSRSKGTKDMVTIAKAADIPTIVIRHA